VYVIRANKFFLLTYLLTYLNLVSVKEAFLAHVKIVCFCGGAKIYNHCICIISWFTAKWPLLS